MHFTNERSIMKKYVNLRQEIISLFFLLWIFHMSAFAQQTLPYQWKNVKIGGGGFVSGIITTPAQNGLIFIRTDVGGAYRYNPADTSWVPMLDWVSPANWLLLGRESVAVDLSNPQCIYMACGMYANK